MTITPDDVEFCPGKARPGRRCWRPYDKDGHGHCEHWWDCKPCCWCGRDKLSDSPDCDCQRHQEYRRQSDGGAEETIEQEDSSTN